MRETKQLDGSTMGTPLRHDEAGERLKLVAPDGREITLEGFLRLGKAPANDVVLGDAWVSRQHCEIRRLPSGRVVVRDLGSKNGTFVNGSRITEAELRAGMSLSVGEHKLRVVAEAVRMALVGRSAAIERLRREVAQVARTSMSVLVHGETGSGKELVAEALHEASGRRGERVAINCGAIARELVESELFGHERGAFTGAAARRPGLFEQAHGGTLFLDEIGELPLELQSRLLRVLESGRVRPVGGTRELPVDVRVVSATHVDLRRACDAGRFRRDLYFRLVQHTIVVPPLRARREDVPLLAARFLEELAPVEGPARLTASAMRKLIEHDWPGNVRELKHALTRAAALGGAVIDAEDLALEGPPSPAAATDDTVQVAGRRFSDIERDVYALELRRHRGNKRQAAQALGIPKSTLCDKVKRYRIDEE